MIEQLIGELYIENARLRAENGELRDLLTAHSVAFRAASDILDSETNTTEAGNYS